MAKKNDSPAVSTKQSAAAECGGGACKGITIASMLLQKLSEGMTNTFLPAPF